MTSTETRDESATATPNVRPGEMKLEVVVVPVSDVGRARAFYSQLGFHEDIEYVDGDFHLAQFTPPGSGCSIIIGSDVTTATPGSLQDVMLSVFDIEAAHADLVARGIEVSEIFHDAGGVFHHAGERARVSGPAPDRSDYGSYAAFSDPDGNGWLLQEVKQRAPGR